MKTNSKNGSLPLVAIIAITAVILIGVIALARPGQSDDKESLSSNGSQYLIAEENNFNFGNISMAAGNVSHTFKIKNTGSNPVKIEKMYTSCMCTSASLKIKDKEFGPYGMPGHGFVPSINQTISSGEEVSVSIIFDPAAHGPAGIGRIERVVIIENNAGKPLEIGFSATVTP